MTTQPPEGLNAHDPSIRRVFQAQDGTADLPKGHAGRAEEVNHSCWGDQGSHKKGSVRSGDPVDS